MIGIPPKATMSDKARYSVDFVTSRLSNVMNTKDLQYFTSCSETTGHVKVHLLCSGVIR